MKYVFQVVFTAHTRSALLMAASAVLFFAACVPVEVLDSPGGKHAQEHAAREASAGQEQSVPEQVPIEVEYFTPTQTEGPYYPVKKPDDRDSDLFILKGTKERPAGTILEFGDTLYHGAGMPVSGAVIEIWQTDHNGIYLHPGDSDSSKRDSNFQSYGEAVTEKDGRYSFRTIMPGGYGRRPRHIHVKVLIDGQELLTTQFYFGNDQEASSDRFFASAGEEVEALIMDIEEGYDFEGNPALIGSLDIILRISLTE